MSDPFDTRAIIKAIGGDPSEFEGIIPLADRLMTGLREGECVVFHPADPAMPATAMCLTTPGDWSTVLKTTFAPGARL